MYDQYPFFFFLFLFFFYSNKRSLNSVCNYKRYFLRIKVHEIVQIESFNLQMIGMVYTFLHIVYKNMHFF